MHAIDQALADGLADRLREAVRPGETCYASETRAGAARGEENPTLRAEYEALRPHVPAGARLVMWFCRSTDGERIRGELALDVKRNGPAVLYPIEGGSAKLEFATHTIVRFDSASDVLAAMGDPCSVIAMTNAPAAAETAELVRALGRRPSFGAPSDESLSFTTLTLESNR